MNFFAKMNRNLRIRLEILIQLLFLDNTRNLFLHRLIFCTDTIDKINLF